MHERKCSATLLLSTRIARLVFITGVVTVGDRLDHDLVKQVLTPLTSWLSSDGADELHWKFITSGWNREGVRSAQWQEVHNTTTVTFLSDRTAFQGFLTCAAP